jgi:hypothetical protein
MVYPICCKYPANPPADGSSTPNVMDDTGLVLTLQFARCSSSLDTWVEVLSRMSSAAIHALLQVLLRITALITFNTTTNTYGVVAMELGSSNFFSLRATLTSPLSPKCQDLASSSYQHTVVLNYAQIFVLGLAGEFDIYGAGRGGKISSVRKFSWYLRASVKDISLRRR